MQNHYEKLLVRVSDEELAFALREFHFRILSLNLTPKTVSVYGERLGQFTNYLQTNTIPFHECDTRSIRSYILSMIERGLSGHSVNGHIRVLKVFFTSSSPGSLSRMLMYSRVGNDIIVIGDFDVSDGKILDVSSSDSLKIELQVKGHVTIGTFVVEYR